MKYVKPYGLDNRLYRIISAANTIYPRHIHRTFEIVTVHEGQARISIDDITYCLTPTMAAVVFPYQYHTYSVDDQSKISVYIFSPEFVPEFSNSVSSSLPINPIFSVDAIRLPLACDLDTIAAKGLFYTLCDVVLKQIPFEITDKSQRKFSLIDEIFLYVDKNYAGDCSLHTLSDTLNYDYTYLSKLFKTKVGATYHQYVNRIRIGQATYLLLNRNISIAEIAYQVGFNSIRTFNREFKKKTGLSPAAYRSQQRKITDIP